MEYGIITHYDVHNHGALLQLNGLIKVLNSLGVEAHALQFDKNYDFMGREYKAKYDISIKSIAIYLSYLKAKGVRCFWYNYNKKRILDNFKKQEHLIGEYYSNCKELDGVIIGSDEVFALHTGPTPVFFGHALPSKKVFAYGGCFGPTKIEDINRLNCRALIESGLANMCGLGMRDQNSIHIAETLTKKKAELVCDPVILYGYDKEINTQVKKLQQPYVVVYSYDGKFDNSTQAIKKFARNRGLKIVSPGFYQSWADINVNANPIEVLGWFKHAEYVITNTFHGCVMSIITGREMVVQLNNNSNKLLNLMREYKIDSRIFRDDIELENVFSQAIDWSVVNEQIQKRREVSLHYLKRMVTL